MKNDQSNEGNRTNQQSGSTGSRSSLHQSGGYRKTVSFQTATLIYDATYHFCEKFLNPRSSIADQMIQAARSGRLKIAKAGRAAATSSRMELRYLNAARAKLEELLLDYEDFLRHRRLSQWSSESPESRAVRDVSVRFKSDHSAPSALMEQTDLDRWKLYSRWLEHADPSVRANAIICLIHQANYVLDYQIDALEKQCIEDAGHGEQPATARHIERQKRKDQPDQIPPCPKCGKPLVLRTAKSGKNAGKQFWGCSAYPECKGVAEL